MGGHKKAGAAVKYGTQSEAGPPTHRSLIWKYKTRQIFSTTISLPPKQKHKLSKCWKDPMLLLGWVIKAKPNPNYPNPRLWLVRRRNKMNIWLKCYSVKRQRRSSVDDLINVPRYFFCRYLLISCCFCPSSLYDSFYLSHRWAWELNVVLYFSSDNLTAPF